MNTVFELIGMGSKKYGGFERYIVEEARQLRDKGCKLVVIFDREPLTKGYIEDLNSYGAEYIILPQNSVKKFIKGFIKLLKKYQPNVVHKNFSSNVFIALPLARLYGVKRTIATEHCFPVLNSLKLRLLYQWISFSSNNIIAVSKRSCESIKHGIFFRKNRVNALYLGIKDFHYDKMESTSHYGINKNKVAIMNVAYHNPIKGVDVLLDAVHILVHKIGLNNFTVYQIGGGQTGTDSELLYNMAKSLKIEDYVVWMGLQNNVPEILSAGDIYVQPSRSEGIPLSIMEASLASLPTVATTVGGNPEAVQQDFNGILVAPDSPQELAEAMEQLIIDAELRNNMGKNARQLAKEKFSLEKQVELLITKYYKIQK